MFVTKTISMYVSHPVGRMTGGGALFVTVGKKSSQDDGDGQHDVHHHEVLV